MCSVPSFPGRRVKIGPEYHTFYMHTPSDFMALHNPLHAIEEFGNLANCVQRRTAARSLASMSAASARRWRSSSPNYNSFALSKDRIETSSLFSEGTLPRNSQRCQRKFCTIHRNPSRSALQHLPKESNDYSAQHRNHFVGHALARNRQLHPPPHVPADGIDYRRRFC